MGTIKEKIYILINRIGNGKINPDKKTVLEQLYPGENFLRKYRDYQMRKYILMLIIILAGIAAAVCMHLSSLMQNRIVEGTHLYRNEWGEGNYSVSLYAVTDSEEGEINYEVKERVLTDEEVSFLKEQIMEILPEIIIGNNESLLAVRENLNLVSCVSDFPFTISWQSSDYTKVRTDGKVYTENLPEEGEEIILTARFSYEEKNWEQELSIRLLPPALTSKEQYLLRVRDAILENDSLYQKSQKIYLPKKIGNESVIWKEKRKDNSFLLLVFGISGAVAASFLMDRKLEQQGKFRREEIAEKYSEFVSKLQLYMGAGLTVKNAFLKIGKEYQQESSRSGKKQFLYEEVLIADYQLLNGKPESSVYREWGRRCGGMKYRKLGYLLASYLRQGNDRILSVLSGEISLALEERKSRARKQGEEAGTKLLFPMMVQLIVVMLLILLPAFSGFGSM